ncbi:PIR Superfamily Protein [Plasmodium ovale curtisi]|uniref:PIR Superfamily Protein n=1 Tax=Plasmodium ovale curtisi TaxID=864141 RepID=A0A1A8XA33_PLAOA|nr:PIR Superfamily Protein [Plasmodium ovale curtisi]SBT02111.1 PIR Superfamily Protein [Plasmodium ovale curtisi]
MTSKDPDIYSFFVNFKEYKRYEQEMEAIYSNGKDNTTCHTYYWDSKQFGNERANNICVKFKILCKVIKSKKRGPKPSILDLTDYAFLNYWLNSISRNSTTGNNLSVDMFQDSMSSIEDDIVGVIFEKKLYDMNDDAFNKMNTLNELKTNYGEIFAHSSDIVKGGIPCIGYFEKFINTYKNCIIKCPDDDTSFCRALKHIKEEYKEELLGNGGISESCIDREKLQLPSYSDALLEYNNVNVVGSILGPSFATLFTSVFLYMFTPLGQKIRAIMRRNKGTDSDLYEENNQSFLSSSDNEHVNVDENSYHISYDTVVNF